MSSPSLGLAKLQQGDTSICGFTLGPTFKTVFLTAIDFCSEDCVKRIWVRGDYSTLSLTLVRVPSASQAIEAVEQAWNSFTAGKDDVIETIDEFSGSPDRDWNIMRWKDWGVATTHGSVFLLLEWHIDWERDIDGYALAMELHELSQMQLQKLKDAGFPP